MTRPAIFDTAPADCWEDAFPVGNGRHGALVWGPPGAESAVVTHHHLVWPDAVDTPSGPPDLAGRLEEVRDLLLAGQSRRALELFTGDWPHHHPRPFHPAFAVTVTDDEGPAKVPDGYRRSLNYRAGVAVTTWPGRRHTHFASRARDLVVQQVTSAPCDLVVDVDARLPGAPAGLRVTGHVDERAPGDALIVTTVEYPGNGGYVGVTRVVADPGDGLTLLPAHRVRAARCRRLTLLTRVAPFRRRRRARRGPRLQGWRRSPARRCRRAGCCSPNTPGGTPPPSATSHSTWARRPRTGRSASANCSPGRPHAPTSRCPPCSRSCSTRVGTCCCPRAGCCRRG